MIAGLAGSEVGNRGAADGEMGSRMEAGEVADGEHAGSESGRDGEVGGWSEVGSGGLTGRAGGQVEVERRAKGGGNLGRGSGEEDAIPAARDGINGKTLPLEPGFGGGNVGGRGAELGGVLVGGDPLVIEG